MRAIAARSREKNREKAAERNREYQKAHKERLAEYQRTYKAAKPIPPVKQREYKRQHRKRHLERVRAQGRQAQRVRRLGGDLSAYAYAEIVRYDPCSYCGSAAGTVDHVQPLTDGGSNEWMNLTGACSSCNSSKRERKLVLHLASR